MTQLIRVEGLTKVYHLGEVEVHALRGVTFSIARGEFIAIMGASGSGKSTFMNILGCLDRPTSGHYLLNGRDVSSVSADERAEIRRTTLGFVFQSFNLLSRTSAVENVELPLVYSAVSRQEQRRRAMRSLQAVGLAGREHHLPSQLSGGQQQRVAIARALVNEPAVILADEPTGNLDTTTSEEILALFGELNRQGITVIVVTHEADIAEFTRRRIVFRDGAVVTDESVGAETETHLVRV